MWLQVLGQTQMLTVSGCTTKCTLAICERWGCAAQHCGFASKTRNGLLMLARSIALMFAGRICRILLEWLVALCNGPRTKVCLRFKKIRYCLARGNGLAAHRYEHCSSQRLLVLTRSRGLMIGWLRASRLLLCLRCRGNLE